MCACSGSHKVVQSENQDDHNQRQRFFSANKSQSSDAYAQQAPEYRQEVSDLCSIFHEICRIIYEKVAGDEWRMASTVGCCGKFIGRGRARVYVDLVVGMSDVID